MSLKWTRAISNAQGLSAKAKGALRVLADRANDAGKTFVGQERLAEDLCVSVRTVRRAVQELEESGWITRERRQRKDGSRTTDLITVHDLEAAAKNAAARLARIGDDQMELSLLRVVHDAVDNTPSNRPNCPVGQPAKLSGLDNNLSPLRNILIYHHGTRISSEGEAPGLGMAGASPARTATRHLGQRARPPP